ncbi:MAG: ferredoxin [Firmicutes bacterium HGW-Firmicutes-12]|jgi:formate hydrogenlyase subunit 6/NADH:ubiquinone oxidoreductase subunit I|nr:MAG: ferredoxin [Firmicutes bacterium HGW-Firmicutes-12]
MSTEIYYFSGTGNSLHVAQELQKRIPQAKLIPMVSLLQRTDIKTKADTVGFVFPIYLTTMPIPVRSLLEKLDVSSAKYIFAVATRKGTFYIADIHIERILNKKRKTLDAFFILDMANNSPCGLVPKNFPGFKKMVNNWTKEISQEKVMQLEYFVQERLNIINEKVKCQEKYRDERSIFKTLFKYLVDILMAPAKKSTGKQNIPFYSDSTCTGCGTCKMVCPSGKVQIVDMKPEWQKDTPCYYCYSCFNSCPEQAILIKDKYSNKDGRYLYPGIGPNDIAAQKPD